MLLTNLLMCYNIENRSNCSVYMLERSGWKRIDGFAHLYAIFETV